MPEKNAPELVATEIQIWPVRNPEASRVKAMASITFNHTLRINGLRIIEGAKGLFLAFPAEKKPGTDQYFSVAMMVNRQAGDDLQAKVLERYDLMVKG